ncbi:MAG TPA: DUF2203 domain-containing protein [Actinomycetota bacterium]|nr:DUF2203 domain-containing protein [Actinomycetota bacterium]
MSDVSYTVESANALLPQLAPALVELREKFEEAEKIREAYSQIAAGNGRSQRQGEEQRKMARVAELLGRLEEWGIQLRDITTGLVDFPAEMSGERVFLCWRLGEEEVAFYHAPEDGFRGRRPLP